MLYLLQSHFIFVYRSFYLSLNKRDPLGDGDDSLQDLGLVSGDLLHVVSTDPDDNQGKGLLYLQTLFTTVELQS